jgi:DNA-binding NarL/FixJ family response regulator
MSSIKLGIIDDHKIFRHGLQLSLTQFQDIQVVFDAADSKELYEKLAHTPVDVLLCDLKLPGQDGSEITKYLAEFFPKIKVVILTSSEDDNTISYLMDAGAAGYLFKDCDPTEIHNAVVTAFNTGYYVNAAVSRALIRKTSKQNNLAQQNLKLTDKEQLVLKYVAEELTASEISSRMDISARTVESIKDRLIKRFEVKNSIGLVAFGLKNKLID